VDCALLQYLASLDLLHETLQGVAWYLVTDCAKIVFKKDVGKYRSESALICDKNKLLDELVEFSLML